MIIKTMNSTALLAPLIDKHIRSHAGFAIYKLPYDNEPHLVVQTAGEPRTFASLRDIDHARGFVMTPANSENQLDNILINPDITACGTEQIVAELTSLPQQQPRAERILPTNNISRADYERTLMQFTQLMRTTELRKVVFARSCESALPESLGTLFVKACEQNNDFFVYLAHSPLCGTWIGCTPETLLCQTSPDRYRTMALAGTRKAAPEGTPWSPKNIEEQRYVHDYLLQRIATVATDFETSPTTTRRAGAIEHICSTFRFATSQGIGTLAALLHPTPAIGGQPQSLAIEALKAYESTRRLYYSGLVGPVGLPSHSSLFVNLRCMMIAPNAATLFAGGGLLAESDPNDEWLETEMKMDTMRAIGR